MDEHATRLGRDTFIDHLFPRAPFIGISLLFLAAPC